MVDPSPRRDERKVHIPAPDSGAAAGRTAAPRRASVAADPRPGSSVYDAPARPQAAPKPAPKPTPASRPPNRPASAPAKPRPTSSPKKSRKRPKLRRILLLTGLLLPVLLLAAAVGGYLYAKSVYDRIEKIPLADVLSASSGSGTNYLIVGSDSRDLEDLVDAGLDPAAFADGGGQRSDTMMLLRFVDGEAKMMSIPRDLYLPIADTGGSQKINAAYNGGPSRLVKTVQQSLGVPVHQYLEVDFVSFAKLVDALGGITIGFEHPAFDRNSGLDVKQAGPVHLDGPQALAYVRSRHYVEVIDGREVPDATGDLGRVKRQQQFLKAVFSELGDVKNPVTLARAAGDAAGGLRVDDTLGFWEALKFAWRLRALDPAPVELPTRLGSNQAGSVLFLEPEADAALAQFK
ncbi:MAG: LCP family protein [Acidimicrobiales bacterium]